MDTAAEQWGKGKTMWYVMQVFSGEENKMKNLCLARIKPPLLNDCFFPQYEEMKKYEGKWHKEKKLLFPGYLILDTERIYDLVGELVKIEGFKRVLGDMDYLVPLSEAEEAFLQRFGGKKQVVEMSIGVIENERVQIISGPMMGMEGCIRKIDRHKRTAKIEVEMFGRTMEATVGVEIIKKIKTE
ncbi:MAG: antiterminator LoaP [Clostridiales bacterium]|nr:antiterminator LoaP [Clostridiales bacterium]